jgi:type I restriction enzyme M protein
VLLDPPWGRENWGTVELYRSARWTYGAPPPRSDDLAWIQVAVGILKPTGRAVLSLPTGSLFRAGSEAEIRKALVKAGVVEAIIELPPRMRTNSSLPVALWLLRSPTTAPREVLMVEASNLGTAGRSTHSLEEDDVERIVRLVNGWRDRQVLPDDASEMAAAVDAAALVSGEVNLTPRRYLRRTQSRSLAALRQAAEDARAEVRRALERAQLAAGPLADHGRHG